MISLSRLLVVVPSCRPPLSSSPLRVLAYFVRSAAPVVSRLIPSHRVLVLLACAAHRSCVSSCLVSFRFVSSRLVIRLIVSLPALRQAGRGVVCLLASASWLVLTLVLPCAPALPLVFSVPPAWLVARGSAPVSPLAVASLACPRSRLLLAFARVSPLFFSPFFDKSGGECVGSLLLVARWCVSARCLLAAFLSSISVSAGAARGVGVDLLGGGFIGAVSAGVLVLVVFGLWCRDLYI